MARTATRRQPARDLSEVEYDAYRATVVARFNQLVGAGAPVFQTGTCDLFDLYLKSMPPELRQYHNCNTCRSFFKRYGGLVGINDDGTTVSLFWNPDDAPEGYYRNAIDRLKFEVETSRVTTPFLSKEREWGTAETGHWHHFAVTPPASMRWVNKPGQLTAGQKMAEMREEAGMLDRALKEFTIEQLQMAEKILGTEAMYQSERFQGVAKWLVAVKSKVVSTPHTLRDNILMRAAATAPAGWCHVKSTMIGTLLEDIAAGLDFDTIKRKFDAKMQPLSYRRPQAAPKAGNIAQANALFTALETSGALRRRFALFSEVQKLWVPQPPKVAPVGTGPFSGVQPRQAVQANVSGAAGRITWAKFQRDVLPSAELMEIFVGHGALPFGALVTAADVTAPNILQWDNLVSWYGYPAGSTAAHWHLSGGMFHPVSAIVEKPPLWNGPDARFNHYAGLFFTINGARDSAAGQCGLGLFPEFLQSQYHGVRATIESFSQRGRLEVVPGEQANGLRFDKASPTATRVRVRSGGLTTEYVIDRWE